MTRAKPEKLRRPKPSRDARIAQAAFRKALGRRDASAFDVQADTPMIGFSAPGIVSDKAMREAKRKAMEVVRADQLLRSGGGERRVGDHLPTKRSAVSPSDRKPPEKKFKGLPGYDLASFLHDELQRREWAANDLFKALRSHGFTKSSDDTVYKWVKGQSTPRLNDMHLLALALGYSDWFQLVAAIKRHAAS